MNELQKEKYFCKEAAMGKNTPEFNNVNKRKNNLSDYKISGKSSFNNITICDKQKPPEFITIDKLITTFKTPYGGYLYVSGNNIELEINEKIIVINGSVEKLFLNAETTIRLITATSIKNIIFSPE